MAKKKSNVAKGKDSYDAEIGGELIAFFNKNITPYATEVGGHAFDLIPVQKQKDIMVNVARMHAEQEYNRIMDVVKVLQKQADEIKRRLYITDAVHAAEYQFQVYHGQTYWLCFDSKINRTRLCHQGPNDWTTGAPESYSYIAPVKWLGDYTWIEVATTQMSGSNTEQSE
jgi:hypothetical protein